MSNPTSHPTFEDATMIREGGYQIGDGKYVVFKVGDFYQMMGRLALPPAWGVDDSGKVVVGDIDCAVLAEEITKVAKEMEVPDATVLRDQDILTAPALSSYADAALTVHDILEGHSPQSFLDSLQKRAEFFRARAMRAQLATNRRLPD